MISVNRVILTGFLGSDADTHVLPSGIVAVNLRLATHDRRNESGAGRGATQWHRVTHYLSAADQVESDLKKGALVLVEGKLRSDTWIDPHGLRRKSWRVLAGTVRVLRARGPGPDRREAARAATDWLDRAPPGECDDGETMQLSPRIEHQR